MAPNAYLAMALFLSFFKSVCAENPSPPALCISTERARATTGVVPMANAGDEQPEAAEDPETAASFKRFKRRGNARKREKAPPAESTADSDDKSAVVRKEAREKAGIQRLHKRPKASLEDDVFGTQDIGSHGYQKMTFFFFSNY